jgi:hypothetical protein
MAEEIGMEVNEAAGWEGVRPTPVQTWRSSSVPPPRKIAAQRPRQQLARSALRKLEQEDESASSLMIAPTQPISGSWGDCSG